MYMKKIAALIASGSGMGADAALHLSAKGFKVAIMSSTGKGEGGTGKTVATTTTVTADPSIAYGSVSIGIQF